MKKTNWFVVILLVMLGALIAAQVFNSVFTNTDKTAVLQEGKIENYFNGDALIIRGEKVTTLPSKNCLEPLISDGSKVAKGELIARSCDVSSLEKKARYDKALLDLVKKIRGNEIPAKLMSSDIFKINTLINEQIAQIRTASVTDSIVDIFQNEANIRNLTNEKINKVMETLSKDSPLIAQKENVDALYNSFIASSKAVEAASAGMISFQVDGYENRFKPEQVDQIKISDIEDVSNSSSQAASVKEINSLKIISGFNAYLAVAVDKSFVDDIEVNDERQIRINDVSTEISAILVSKKVDTKNRFVLVFKFDRGIEETCDLRKVNIDIANGRFGTTGIKIPKESLMNANYTKMTAKIAIVKAHKIVFRNVKILDFDASYAIIIDANPEKGEAVMTFDEYVKKPSVVKEGEILK